MNRIAVEVDCTTGIIHNVGGTSSIRYTKQAAHVFGILIEQGWSLEKATQQGIYITYYWQQHINGRELLREVLAGLRDADQPTADVFQRVAEANNLEISDGAIISVLRAIERRQP